MMRGMDMRNLNMIITLMHKLVSFMLLVKLMGLCFLSYSPTHPSYDFPTS